MRKAISMILVLAIVLSGFASAFASADGSVPSDVKGTKYEEAVKALIDKGVITGYPDGSFRPGEMISRAEACVIIVNSMNPTDEELAGAPGSGFPDMAGYEWAAGYVNYAVLKGVVNGYPDGTFRPGDNVTYAEMAVMLILALGCEINDLTGAWPDNFISKATELGIFSGIGFSPDDAAVRGNVALMSSVVADDIAEANRSEGDENQDTETPSNDNEYEDLAGPLAEYSGRAYGIILDYAEIMNDEGDIVKQIEFLFGKNILFLNTDGRAAVPVPGDLEVDHNEGILHGLRMNNGVVKKIDYSDNSFADIDGDTDFLEFTSGWDQIIDDSSNGVVEFDKDDTAAVDPETRSIIDDASIYVAIIEGNKITGYEEGSFKDIKEGYWIRLYSVTDNNPGVAEVVLISEINPVP